VKAPGERPSRNRPATAARDPLVTELANAESDLERIEAQRSAAKDRIATLRNELATLDPAPRPVAAEPLSGPAPRTPADKVKLFRQL
jgi:outer membrane protein TolC